MSALSAIKALVTVTALGLGAGTVALVVEMQRNPYELPATNREPEKAAPEAREVAPVPLPVAVELSPPAALTEPETPTAAIQKIAKQNVQASLASTPKKVWVRPTPKADAPDETQDRVIPAPCVNGEYRMLDESRGVRLMCPPKP